MATTPPAPQASRLDESPRTGGAPRRRRMALPAAAVALLAAAIALRAPAATPAAPAPAPAKAAEADPPSEKEFKNIQVLKGMPSSQMASLMHVMRASLGVRCDYCHVIEGDRYDLDTKPEKETSREMMRMVFEINQQHFGGHTQVTCQTCHHGQVHPARVASLELGFIVGPGPAPPAAKLPAATEVLDRYIAALGGRAALEAVKSRVSRGTVLHLGVVGDGTPAAHGVNRGQEDPLEIVERVGGATLSYGPPTDRVVETFAGGAGTVKSPRSDRALSPEELGRLAYRVDLRYPLELRDRAATARTIGKGTIDGREVYLVRIKSPSGDPALLSFDVATGLLRRQEVDRPTLVGPDPDQTDYEDYRAVGNLRVPFLVRTSELDDFHYGTTRKLTEVRDNPAP